MINPISYNILCVYVSIIVKYNGIYPIYTITVG